MRNAFSKLIKTISALVARAAWDCHALRSQRVDCRFNRARKQAVQDLTCGTLALLTVALLSAPAAGNDSPDWIPESDVKAGGVEAPASDKKLFLEVSGTWAESNPPMSGTRQANIGLDAYATKKIGADWVAALNTRVDLDTSPAAGISNRNLSLTLRELYASGKAGGWALDIGRINIRDGVATGFNPTDVFRDGALLARRTADPARLRESRLGVVGMRIQHGIGSGSVAIMGVPHLGQVDTPSWYDPHWGAANHGQAQGYLLYTAPRWQGFYCNALLHTMAQGGNTWGLNLSNNLGQSVVAYLEYANTRRIRALELAQGAHAASRRYSQAALGISLTTETRQTVTLEYDFNDAGLRHNEWQGAWQTLSPNQLSDAITESGARQDPLGAHSLMGMVQWDRFLSYDADLSCLMRANLVDKSRLSWCEWRYKLPHTEFTLSASRQTGAARSEYGASSQAWLVGAKMRLYY